MPTNPVGRPAYASPPKVQTPDPKKDDWSRDPRFNYRPAVPMPLHPDTFGSPKKK